MLGEWLQTVADVLRVSAENTSRADGSVAGLLGSIGVVERSGGAGAVAGLMGQTLSQYENANSFANPRPAAGAQGSLPVLHQQLMATQVAQATAAAAFWAKNAALVQSVVSQLPAVAGLLADSSETEFVARAINKLGEVSRVGQEYVARSVLMQGHAAGLAQVAGAEQLMAHGAMAVWAGLPGPSRALFEQSYLGVFPPRLTASLQPVVPVFDRLLPDLGSIPGDGFAVGDMPSPQVPGFGDSPLPRTLRDAFTAAGLGALGQAVTPAQVVGEYGLPTPEVLEQVAAKTPAGVAGTEAASVGLGQLAPAGAGAGLVPTTGAGGAGTLSQPGAAGLAGPVVRVARAWVVSRPRWLPVPVVLAVALVVLVVWRAQSAPVPVQVVGVDPVHTVRVDACRVMHTRVRRLVLRVLLLVGRWVLARALPVPGLVLVWALVVVLQASARVCQVLQARYQVRQRPLVPVRVRPVVVGV